MADKCEKRFAEVLRESPLTSGNTTLVLRESPLTSGNSTLVLRETPLTSGNSTLVEAKCFGVACTCRGEHSLAV